MKECGDGQRIGRAFRTPRDAAALFVVGLMGFACGNSGHALSSQPDSAGGGGRSDDAQSAIDANLGTGGLTGDGGLAGTGGVSGTGGRIDESGAGGDTGGAGGSTKPGGTGGELSTGGVGGKEDAGGAGDGLDGGATAVCGSAAGAACASSSDFCELPVGACAPAPETRGVCILMPSGCPAISDPVCGCDGTTYGNDCVRQAFGVSKAAPGPCAPIEIVDGGDAGAFATLEIFPKSGSFTQESGTTSELLWFTIRNIGANATGPIAVRYSGSPTLATVAVTCLAPPLQPGQACQVAVVFNAPPDPGSYSGTLQLTDYTTHVIYSIPLTGYASPSFTDAGP
jgi:hypothetical protein